MRLEKPIKPISRTFLVCKVRLNQYWPFKLLQKNVSSETNNIHSNFVLLFSFLLKMQETKVEKHIFSKWDGDFYCNFVER